MANFGLCEKDKLNTIGTANNGLRTSSPIGDFQWIINSSFFFFQEMLLYKKNVSLLIFFVGFICGISVISLCGSIIFHLLENFKDEDEVCEEEASRDQADGKNKDD
jgi:hypothetical protein